MKRFACLLALLGFAGPMLCMGTPAHAAGIGLRWGSCEGTPNRTFACDRSTGSELLVGSFEPPGGISQLTGIEALINITAADGNVPSWWQAYNAGSCRRTSITASFDLSDQTECDDPFSGQAMGGSGSGIATFSPSSTGGSYLWLVAAVPTAAVQPAQSGRRYAAFKLLINHQKSSGPGACAGCATPVCISFEAIRLVQPSTQIRPGDPATREKNAYVTSGLAGMGGSSQVATWQGGTANCGAGLAKPATWSELKSRFKSK